MQAVAATKKNRGWFAKTEGRLYAYSALTARYGELADKSRASKDFPLQSPGFESGGKPVGAYGDKTAEWVLKREAIDESFAKAFKEFEIIDGFLKVCSPDEKEFVEMRYFKNWARSTIVREMSISLTTYYRLRETTVTRAAAIFGYLEYDEYVKMLAL